MSFCAAVNCMDGRVQDPIVRYLSGRFGVRYVDMITEAGPAGVLAAEPESTRAREIYRKVRISIDAHGSRGLAIVAHDDCAGNSKSRDGQMEDLRGSANALRGRFPGMVVVALWVEDGGAVTEVPV
jgi:hypothetical protein